MANNHFEQALPLLEELAADSPEDLPSWIELGRACLGLRRFDRAMGAFETALKLDPGNVGTRFYIAYAHEEQGNSDKALAAFRKLLDDTSKPSGKYSPREFEDRLLFRRHLAVIYQDSGQLEKAIEEFRALLQLQNRPEHYRTLIGALRLARRNPEALDLSREGIDKYPGDKYLGMVHSQLVAEVEDFARGEELAREIRAAHSADVDAVISLSQIYLQARKYDSAREHLLEAREQFPDSEVIQFQLGAVYERSGQHEEAEEQFLAIIGRNPQHANALNYLGYMWADRGVRLTEALDYIQMAVNLEPNNGAYLDSLGWVYFKLDRLQEAEHYLDAAVRRVPGDPTIHEHLGDLYFKRGQYKKAEEAWQQAILHGTVDEEINKVKEKLQQLKKMLKIMQ